jgi:hypothetical protein
MDPIFLSQIERFGVGRPILAAACLRAGFLDDPQKPPEMRLQPKLAALQGVVC